MSELPPTQEGPVEELDSSGVDSVDFSDPTIYMNQGISPGRWERAKTAIDVRDLIRDLYGLSGNPISCPFHGRDSKPSFYIFPKPNDCWCWGCGQEDGYWNTIKIVARHFGYRRDDAQDKDDLAAAVRWIERNYPMPALKDDDEFRTPDMVIVEALESAETDESDDPFAKLRAVMVEEPYIRTARRIVDETRTSGASEEELVATAAALTERLFISLKQDNPIPLARVVGADVVRAVLRGELNIQAPGAKGAPR